MHAAFDPPSPNPLAVPELASYVVSYIDDPVDLLHCACVNWTWNSLALQKLYRGSMNDMRYRTPDIGSLNSLFVASRERFARNMRFVKCLTIAPETPAPDEAYSSEHRPACIEKCRPLRDRKKRRTGTATAREGAYKPGNPLRAHAAGSFSSVRPPPSPGPQVFGY